MPVRDKRTYKIIGAAIQVHNELGCGFNEAVYQEALGREFSTQEIPFKSQPGIRIDYKGIPLRKSYQPFFVCFDELLVEIKALSSLSEMEEAQIINYLKASGFRTGLLINFGTKSLEFRRYINTGEYVKSEAEQSAKAGGVESAKSANFEPGKSTNTKSVKSADRFQNWEYPEIEDGKLTKYNWMVQHLKGFTLGYYTDIGAFTYINAKNGVIIEDYVEIGSHCSIYSISTIDNKAGRVLLKRNCKIGSHSIVMPGITVGENSIVGACSFVNSDIPDNVIAVGVPAKVIRQVDTASE